MDGMKRVVSSVRIDRAVVVPVWALFPLLRQIPSEGDEDEEGVSSPFLVSMVSRT